MRRALRHLGLLALGMLAALTGCNPPVGMAVYGPPPVQHDPTVEVTDFSYQPASPAHVGDTLRFTATTNAPFFGWEGEIRVVIGNEQTGPLVGYDSATLEVLLNDYGWEADVAQGELEWLAEYGPQQELPVAAHLWWTDGYMTEAVFAAPLTVLEAEEQQ